MAQKQQIVVCAAGSGGVEEMQKWLDDAAVMWAILRFALGSGSFRRQKLVFLHFNGDECGVIVRGRLNALTSTVQDLIRSGGGKNQEGFHASLEVKRAEDVTLEEMLNRLSRFFITDSGEFTVTTMLQDYEKQIKEAETKRKTIASQKGGEGQKRLSEKIASLFTKGSDALAAVAKPLGPWNWALFGPDPVALPIIGGGGGSVDEMRGCIEAHEKDVMFGLLRMGFGEGKLRRTKYIFIHACGSKA